MALELDTLRPHDHPCLIYETKEEQAAAFVPYLQSGLMLGEKCIYLVDESSPQWVLDALRVNDFPIDDYVDSGALSIVSTQDAYLQGGYFETQKMVKFWENCLSEANAAGFTALRAAAEMTWALSNEPGCEQLVPYESHLNCVFPQATISALCQYNRRRFPANVIKNIIHVHPIVVADGEVLQNPGFIKPEEFIESHADMDVRVLIDNLSINKKLASANEQLREVLAAQQRAQAAAEERQREYESMYKELLSLAHVVSHELQAPLSVMQSYIRLLAARYRSQLGADAEEFIDKSLNASGVVAKMIDDLWNYARVDAPTESIVEEVDCDEMLDHVLQSLAPLIEESGATVVRENQLPFAKMSRRHLEFLLTATIRNAIQYGKSGLPPVVKIGANETDEGCIFRITDNGRGIDSIHSLDVFKLFHRLNDIPGESGTGMGLAICKRVVQLYKGKIWFESEPGAQTSFFFSIPHQTDGKVMLRLVPRDGRAEELA
jgi:signal transduction histidine kinase